MERASIGTLHFLPLTGVVNITGYITAMVADTDCEFCQYTSLYPQPTNASQLLHKLALRPLASTKEVADAIADLSGKPLTGSFGHWNKQQKELTERLRVGTPKAHASILRRLFDIDGKRAAATVALCEQAQRYLAGEYAAVHGIAYDNAVADIRKRLVNAYMASNHPSIPARLKKEYKNKTAAL